jgi:hypothetical protein
MQVSQVQLKMIALVLIPVFLILSLVMPKTTTTAILSAAVMVSAIAISITGWFLQKRETVTEEDLLAVPPKRP